MDTELLKRKLRILHLEDNENDHFLLAEVLAGDGINCDFVVVRSKQEYVEALARGPYDLIISDYTLPSYDGLKALAAAREKSADTPFIVFSGTIGEEVAVESLRHGAMDYVLKQRPGRLTAAVRRALRTADQRIRLKRVERALEESQARLRIVAKATNDVVWEWDLQTDRVWFGENFAAAFGHDVEPEMMSAQWFDFIHPADKDGVVSSLGSLLAAGGRVWWNEHRLRRGDGSYAHIFDRASVIYDEPRKAVRVVGIKVDISARKKAEEKIREQAALLDKTRDAIIVCNPDHRIVFWNQGAERLYGWPAGEAVGRDMDELLFGGELPPQLKQVGQDLEAKGEWMGELQQRTRDGGKIIVRTRTTVIRDDLGRAKSLMTIGTDITEHKQLEEQFLRSQRLESLGVLVGGIAHDLNNTLVPILIGVEILEGENLSEDAAGMVRTMGTSARRSAEMIQQMLAFARGGEAARLNISPDRLLNEMGRVIKDTFPKSIQCRVTAPKGLHPIYCVPTQMHQILMNLCVNARDAMPDGGRLGLWAENVELDASAAGRLAGARPGKFVCISVTDTGTGMTPEQMGKLFQPFFTTKAVGKGTGLGLSTCWNIIKNHEGFITVQSQVNAGSQFKVYLPAADAKSEEPAAPVTVALPAGKGERILVIDDEECILAMTQAALENFGYAVHTALSGVEALAYFGERPEAVQLVITDHSLPLMGGGAIISALRKIRPDIKIILTSGSQKDVEETLRMARTDGFLAKPFTTEELLNLTHRALAG